jgi:hypothetical protein
MFPLIAAFIATGRVFSAIAIHSGGTLNQIIGFLAYFAPYFLIPLTFKFAGGFVRQLGGFVNDRSKGGFDRLRNFRTARRQAGFKRIQAGGLFRNAPEGSRKDRLNKAYQAASLFNPDEISANPRRWRAEARALRERANVINANEAIDSKEFAPIKGDDDTSQAAVRYAKEGRQSAYNYLKAKGFNDQDINQKLAHIDQLRKKFGAPAFNQAAIMSAVMASTAYMSDPITGEHEGIGELLSDIDWASGGNDQVRAQLIGQVKTRAQQAGRMDLVAPFSDMYEQSRLISQAQTPEARRAAIHKATDVLTDKIVLTEGAGFILGGKGAAVENLIPGVQRRLERSAGFVRAAQEEQAAIDAAAASGATTWTSSDGATRPIGEAQTWSIEQEDKASREMKRSLAATAALHDVASQLSDEKAGMLGDLVLGQRMPQAEGNASVLQTIDAYRGDDEFNEFRNDFMRRYASDAQTQAQAMAAAAAGLTGPPAVPPAGPAATP